jgi:hypothetical protein
MLSKRNIKSFKLKSVVINDIVLSAQESDLSIVKKSSKRWKINSTLKKFVALIQQIALDKWSKIIGELLQPKASLMKKIIFFIPFYTK